jgi:sugar lactone lactonase YvrE
MGAALLLVGPQLAQASSRDAQLVYVGLFGPGTGDRALSGPADVEVDGDGNIYVLDTPKSRIQKYDNKGNFLMTIGSGEGSQPGQLYLPRSMALDRDGAFLYVADSANSRVQVFDASSGESVQTFGKYGFGDGELNYPAGIAVYDDNVYVADSRSHRVEIFSAAGVFKKTFGSEGQGDNQFGVPLGIAVDASGIYVGDEYYNTLKRFSLDGTYVQTLATGGDEPGQLAVPEQLALCTTEEGNHLDLYVVDENHGKVDHFGIYPDPTSGSVWEYLDSFTGSSAPDSHFAYPQGVGCYYDDTKRSDVLVASTGEGMIYHFHYAEAVKIKIDPNESPARLQRKDGLTFEVSHNAMSVRCTIETARGSVTIPHPDEIGDDVYSVKGPTAQVRPKSTTNYEIPIDPGTMRSISKAIKMNKALKVELEFKIGEACGERRMRIRYTIK